MLGSDIGYRLLDRTVVAYSGTFINSRLHFPEKCLDLLVPMIMKIKVYSCFTCAERILSISVTNSGRLSVYCV